MVNCKQAVSFLMQQIVDQASKEGVSLSEREKRMLCFSENDCGHEDEFTTPELIRYDAKISTLLHHAYRRMRTDGPDNIEAWSHAIRALEARNHYLLPLLWDILPAREGWSSRLKRLGISALITIGLAIGVITLVSWAYPK